MNVACCRTDYVKYVVVDIKAANNCIAQNTQRYTVILSNLQDYHARHNIRNGLILNGLIHYKLDVVLNGKLGCFTMLMSLSTVVYYLTPNSHTALDESLSDRAILACNIQYTTHH